MKVLFDTNVILDFMLERQPFCQYAEQLIARVEMGKMVGYLAATSIITIHYLIAKAHSARKAEKEVNKLFSLFEIAPVTRGVLEYAVTLKFKDYEDAVIHEAARQVDVDAIVTRDEKDFKKASLPVYTPGELLKVIVTFK